MPKKICTKRANLFSNETFLRKRELGFRRKLGFYDELCRKLTSSLDACHKDVNDDVGGIFNLEFSLDGSILAAACEKKSINIYDALNQKHLKRIDSAHSNCVNCVKFIDHNTFASGSDDSTIQIWDLRFLKESTRTLRGHTNWVKNIEYCSKSRRLVSSGFDGTIYSWDLNNFTESGVINNRAFMMDGLMRMKLTPDGSKMIICATTGYMIIVHDLNLETLYTDLQRFKPNVYRLMQISDQNIPAATSFNNLFSLNQKRNRVELVSDFPNEAEVISSLQIHPMGWCALTRNINSDELSEWTCVHDIQERFDQEYIYKPITYPLQSALNEPEITQEVQRNRSPMDLWMGFVTNQSIREQRRRIVTEFRGTGIRTTRTSVQVLNSGILDSSDQQRTNNNTEGSESPPPIIDEDDKCKIVKNLSRLTHYIEEPNVGKGFIKEVGFSADGRIMCSPYNTGIRLFSFNYSCNELSTCVPENPQKLTLLTHYKDYHPEIVVSSKFNPYHCSLVSGCLGGQIVWYHPKF